MGLRIGVDIDGVISDHLPPRCARAHAWYGTDISPEDITDTSEPFPGTNISMDDHVRMLYAMDTGHFLDMPVIEGARTSLKHLQNAGHTIILISHRTEDTYEITEEWLEDRRVPYDELFVGAPRNKTSLVPLDVLIDASVENVNRACSGSTKAILFCRHYNEIEMDNLSPEVVLPESTRNILHTDLAQQWRDVEKRVAELNRKVRD